MRDFVRAGGAIVALLTGAALTACATPQTPQAASPAQPIPTTRSEGVSNLTPHGYEGRFAGFFTVLESPGHGPQLCSVVATSYPPQCGGPDIAGWDWSTVESESFNGTTWGDYFVVGTWDEAARVFTLTERALRSDEVTDWERSEVFEVDFTSPCPTPSGGWRPVDPSKATQDALERANLLAEAEPDFAGSWIDQGYLPESGYDEGEANDPQRFVLNMRFTGDLARHEAQLRAVWGGALCVSKADRTLAETEAIISEVATGVDHMGAMSDVTTGVVWVTVLVATEERQAELDAEYGAGTIKLQGLLRPIDRD